MLAACGIQSAEELFSHLPDDVRIHPDTLEHQAQVAEQEEVGRILGELSALIAANRCGASA